MPVSLAYCKRIRDGKGSWHQFEVYIRDLSEADFSHGIRSDSAHTHFATPRQHLLQPLYCGCRIKFSIPVSCVN
jgi:hypothetical protein